MESFELSQVTMGEFGLAEHYTPSWMQANNAGGNNQNQTPASQMQTPANWAVEKASTIVILGPSGGGKTCFLNYLLNFDR